MQQIKLRWIILFEVIFSVYIGLPFLAPVLMHLGWKGMGNAIYFVYSFLCHQLPERSFFLFGPKLTYSLQEIHAVGQDTRDIILLRKFIGNPAMGWKVAWSDRMVSMFTSIWIFVPVWRLLRRRLSKLPIWGFVLFLLPMALDGSTHFLSDLAGIGQGFRDTNLWLAALTGQVFPSAFYAGDAWGSFNSLMRLLTGILFGLGLVWFALPYISELVSEPEMPVRSINKPLGDLYARQALSHPRSARR